MDDDPVPLSLNFKSTVSSCDDVSGSNHGKSRSSSPGLISGIVPRRRSINSVASILSSCTPPPPLATSGRHNLCLLFSQIRAFHTTFMLQLFSNRRIRKRSRWLNCFSMKNTTKQTSTEYHSTRRSSAFMYKPRANPFAKRYHELVNRPLYKTMVIVVAFIAMYARDLCLALLPKQCDVYILDGLLTLVLLLQSTECVLYTVTHYNYFLTFLFWFELAGTATVIFDIPMFKIGDIVYDSSDEEHYSMLRMVRMLKLFRFVHVLKLLTRKELETEPGSGMNVLLRNLRKMGKPKTSVESHQERRKESEDLFKGDMDNVLHPNTMSSVVGDGLSQKLILGVLLKFFMLPFFDVGGIDFDYSAKYQLDSIHDFYINHAADIEAADSANTVSASYYDDYQHLVDRFLVELPNALYLSISNDKNQRIEINEPELIESLRDIERRRLFTSTLDQPSFAILNIRQHIWKESMLNMGLTTYLLSVFFVGYSAVIQSHFRHHLVAPQRFLLKANEMIIDIIFDHLQHSKHPVDFKKHSLLQSIWSTNTAIFFSHRYPSEFLKNLESPPMDQEEDDEDEEMEIGSKRMSMSDTISSHHGIQIDADVYETLQRARANSTNSARRPSDWSREAIPDWLLQRYLGNSGSLYEIVITEDS